MLVFKLNGAYPVWHVYPEVSVLAPVIAFLQITIFVSDEYSFIFPVLAKFPVVAHDLHATEPGVESKKYP